MLIATEGIDGAGKTTVRNGLMDYFEESNVVTTTEPYDEEWLGEQVRDAISDDSTHPLSVFFVFMADHVYHYENIVRPALDDGNIVISDRYIDSRYAYQGYAIDEFVDGDTLNYIRTLQESGWTVNDSKASDILQVAEEEMPERIYTDTPKIGRYFYGLSQSINHLPPLTGDGLLTDPRDDLIGLTYTEGANTWTKLPDKTILIDISVDTSMKRQSGDKEVFEYADFLENVRENYLKLAEMDKERFEVIDGEQSKEAVRSEVLELVSN